MRLVFYFSPFFGSETVSEAIITPARVMMAQAIKGDSVEDTSHRKPPIVEPTTRPMFRKMLKSPILFPLREAGTRVENMAVIEGLDAARPKPLNIITNSNGQKPPESTMRITEMASTSLPKIKTGFLPVLSATAPIGKTVTSITDP